jgi:hypothetical protein
MSISCKGFIILNDSANPFEALNIAAHRAVRLCEQNTIFRKREGKIHPFKLVGADIGSPYCYYIRFTNSRDNGETRMIQIGYWSDTIEAGSLTGLNSLPKSNKICFSIGSHGDCKAIVKEFMQATAAYLKADSFIDEAIINVNDCSDNWVSFKLDGQLKIEVNKVESD